MTPIVAYTYEADIHCPACTQARWYRAGFNVDWASHVALARDSITVDEHQVPFEAIDSEHNKLYRVYPGDEVLLSHHHCGDCRKELTA